MFTIQLLLPFRAVSPQGGAPPSMPVLDPSFKRAMVYLFMGTRGGRNRVKIVEMVKDQPSNPNRISEVLDLDYKTVQHHLKVLGENGVLVANDKESYGAIYFLTPYFEKYYGILSAMWAEFGESEK
ncbi:MAG TPA: winged helix-turn-helix domain-containing protein [Nitrososphaerales archaeon]|nr:winged helix-turn-helix domain-containing protein [Nitrososphaerales archaeon]